MAAVTKYLLLICLSVCLSVSKHYISVKPWYTLILGILTEIRVQNDTSNINRKYQLQNFMT
jgi:hypothetical protein